MRISTKLVVVGSAILMVPLAFLGIFITVKANSGIQDIQIGNLNNQSRSMALYTDTRLEGDMRSAMALARDDEVRALMIDANAGSLREADARSLTEKLSAIVTSGVYAKSHDAICVLDKRGLIVVATDPKAVGVKVPTRDYFQNSMAGKTFVGQVLVGVSGKTSAGISSPILDDAGNPIGVLALFISSESLTNDMAKYKLGDSGYFMVVDRTGLIILHPDKEISLKQKIQDQKGWEGFAQMVLSGKAGDATYAANGKKMVAAFSPVQANEWMIVATLPEGELIATATTLRNIIALTAFIAIIAACFAFFFLAKSITGPLIQATIFANKFADGDLITVVRDQFIDRSDELGDLAVAFRDMRDHIRNVVMKARAATEKVSTGSDAVSATALQLSQGATEQASSAEEISASIEEMTATVRQNADNAQATEGMAQQAAQDAALGNASVTKAIEAMREIVERISIIENIASQTNLLALNAAIEAARAGEFGKGFAVVASEVRKLAERSAKAASEITELSQGTMDAANEAGGIIGQIVPNIQKTAELVQEIASASREQSMGIDQIQKAMMQLDSVTQQNASASEEMAGTSEELARQAEELKNSISYFKLEKGSTRPMGESNATQSAPKTPGNSSGSHPEKDAKAVPVLAKKSRAITPVIQARDEEDMGDDGFESF